MSDLYSVQQAAKMLDKPLRTVQRWCEQGKFPHAQKINPTAEKSAWVIPADDVVALKDQLIQKEK